MPVWIWVLLGLSAVGFVLWFLANRVELGAAERFQQAIAILFILAVIVGLVLSFVYADWQ